MPEEPMIKGPGWRKIILFNGPPRCGKSFGASCMATFIRQNAQWMQPAIMDFAEPLKKAAHALYCVFHSYDFYDFKENEHLKSVPSGDFLGMSPREAYIALSEEFLKPRHGEEVLGFLMKKRILRQSGSNVIIIPNSGFIEELKPLVDLVSERNILLVEVHAANKTFDGDSRSYVGDTLKEKYPNIELRKIPNVFGSPEDKEFYKMLCEGTVKKFLNIEEKE